MFNRDDVDNSMNMGMMIHPCISSHFWEKNMEKRQHFTLKWKKIMWEQQRYFSLNHHGLLWNTEIAVFQVERNFCVWLDHPWKPFKASAGDRGRFNPTKKANFLKTQVGRMELLEASIGLINVCVSLYIQYIITVYIYIHLWLFSDDSIWVQKAVFFHRLRWIASPMTSCRCGKNHKLCHCT